MTIIFDNGYQVAIPDATAEAIAKSTSKYETPLWAYRAEKVLKLGHHQWVVPFDFDQLKSALDANPAGIKAIAWKLFTRGWLAHAPEYFHDTVNYPNHPRHYGANIIPLVDEDADSQQIGWARIDQYTSADENFVVYVEFTIVELFDPITLPQEYK